MKKRAVLIVVIIFAILCLPGFTGLFTGPPEPTGTYALVIRVIDGDTIVLEDDERVRLLGIDTPERGRYYFEEAGERLREMVDGKEVLLETDKEERDKYDRLLRYVWINKTLTNLELVREGYARTFMLEPGDKYFKELVAVEAAARESGLGIWQFPDIENYSY